MDRILGLIQEAKAEIKEIQERGKGRPKTHELKVWPEYYEAISINAKPFEVRKDDRGFELGDHIRLREYNPKTGEYGREHHRVITYILKGGNFGVEQGFVVLGFGTVILFPHGAKSLI